MSPIGDLDRGYNFLVADATENAPGCHPLSLARWDFEFRKLGLEHTSRGNFDAQIALEESAMSLPRSRPGTDKGSRSGLLLVVLCSTLRRRLQHAPANRILLSRRSKLPLRSSSEAIIPSPALPLSIRSAQCIISLILSILTKLLQPYVNPAESADRNQSPVGRAERNTKK